MACTGRQVNRTVIDEFADNGATLLFEVDEVFKGDAGPLVEVRTHADTGGACGIDAANVGDTGVIVWRELSAQF